MLSELSHARWRSFRDTIEKRAASRSLIISHLMIADMTAVAAAAVTREAQAEEVVVALRDVVVVEAAEEGSQVAAGATMEATKIL